MSEQTAPVEGSVDVDAQAAEFQAITSQEELDRVVQSRLARERAKFADYDQAKADAAELAKIRDAQRTSEEKQAAALAEAQAKIAELESAKARAEVAAAKGVPVELLTGSSREELEAVADALIAFKGEAAKGPVIPNQGVVPSRAAGTVADQFASWSEQFD